jgi:hypothetical protein
MKKLILLFTSILITFNCALLCQTAKPDSSNAEMFASKPELFIEKQFIEIGFVDMIELRIMKIKDLNSGITRNALRFEYQTTNQIFSQTKLAIVDEDELDALIASVHSIITKEFIIEKETYTEVTFQSRSGFVAGAYYTIDKKKWIPFLQLERHDSKSTITVSHEDFSHFLDLLKQAKKMI